MIKSLIILATIIDGLAATVNSDSILRSEVMQELGMKGQPYTEMNYQDALNDLIDSKLIVAAAGRSKMTMQEWVVESRVQDIIKRSFDGDRNRLMEELAKDRIPYAKWRQRLRDDMIVSSMRYQMIDKNVTATPAAIRKEYEENPDKYCTAGEGKVSVTVWLLSPDGTERVDEYKDILPESKLLPDVCNVIRNTPVGETSDWCPYGDYRFCVRKDAEDVEKMQLTLAEAFPRVEEEVKRKRAEELYQAWIKTLRQEAYIKVY